MTVSLFAFPAPRVFTIPPAVGFLDAVASAMADVLNLKSDPSALAGAVIYTPNRRAARALAECFHQAALDRGQAALISPDIRVLGDLQDDDAIAPIGVSELDLGPPLKPAVRRGTLARMVQAWRKAQGETPLPPGSALSAADELSALLDQSAMGDDVDWSRLNDLTLNADLAAHWQVSAKFLEIITTHWPSFLAEQGATDPMARRVAAAEALSNQWAAHPPDHPVIIAGSTGATPATRTLMKAAMKLPKGAVILPGLDGDKNAEWASIKNSPSHPQFTLARALKKLDVTHDIPIWPGAQEDAHVEARRKLINEALAPADATKNWKDRLEELSGGTSPDAFIKMGLEGLTLIEAEDEAEEALAAALMLRETLETPGRTAALVTPDPALARRVSALLKRWDIDVAPSSGFQFLHSPQGALLTLVFKWLEDPGDPVSMLALLKNSLVRMGLTEAEKAAAMTELERHPVDLRPGSPENDNPLRGPRRWTDLGELADLLNACNRSRAAALISQLNKLAFDHDVSSLTGDIEGRQMSECAARFTEALALTEDQDGRRIMWRGRNGAAAADYLESLADLCEQMGPIPSELWAEFARAAATNIKIPPKQAEHRRLAIWGPLEARLQTRDLLVIASLNEGVQPAAAPADSFLPRRLRNDLGLPDPEERVGLSAHDFSQLACQKDVVLLRAKRVENKPAVASRWIWRLRTLASGALGEDATQAALAPLPDRDPLVWAEALRHVESYQPSTPPEPKPPMDARPTKFSVSRVTRLIRDPYSVYAGDILRLKPMDPPGVAAGVREKGIAIHAAVERYDEEGETGDLLAIICEELKQGGVPKDEIALSRPLWARAARAYLDWRASREKRIQSHWLEKKGEMKLGDFTISGTADRIELLNDGSLAIIDFKTGSPKTKKQVESGLEPQLPLEAAIAAAGGYSKHGVPAKPTSEIIYVSLAPGASAVAAKNGVPVDVDPMEEAEKAVEGFVALANAYLSVTQPYRSKPRVEFTWAVSDYDRLARRAEWTSDDGGEE